MSRLRPQRTGLATAALLIAALAAGALVWQSAGPASAQTVGDANCDGDVTAVDASLVLQITADIIHSLRCAAKADANGDGELGAVDSAIILQFTAGLIDHIGPEASATPAPTRTPTPAPTATVTQPPTATVPPAATPTPAATATRTATSPAAASATATATRTATIPPTPTTPNTLQARHTSSYADGPDLWVVGEIYNGTNQDVAVYAVTAELFSATNQLLASEMGFTCVSAIARHTDSPFDVLVLDAPQGVDHITVRVTDFDQPSPDPPVEDLDVVINTPYEDKLGYHVPGEIFNGSHNDYAGVLACVALYDASGNVVRTDYADSDPDFLEPDDVGEFDAIIPAEGLNIVTQRVWVEAAYG